MMKTTWLSLLATLFLAQLVQGKMMKVTQEVYMDIATGDAEPQRVVIGLFGDIVPKTVKNFVTLATDGIFGLSYKNTRIHRVVNRLLVQGGDVVHNNGTGRISIYGATFPDESFFVGHNMAAIVSMANSGKDTNGCQFFITTTGMRWLDKTHVAFGKVVRGMGHIHNIERLKTDWDDVPLTDVIIKDSGLLPLSSPYDVTDDVYDVYYVLTAISTPIGTGLVMLITAITVLKKLNMWAL